MPQHPPPPPPSPKQELGKAMLDLHDDLTHELQRPVQDPARLLRLMATALQQLLVERAMSLPHESSPPPDPPPNPNQLKLFQE